MTLGRLQINLDLGSRKADRGPAFYIRWYTKSEWKWIDDRKPKDLRGAPPSKNERRERSISELWK